MVQVIHYELDDEKKGSDGVFLLHLSNFCIWFKTSADLPLLAWSSAAIPVSI